MVKPLMRWYGVVEEVSISPEGKPYSKPVHRTICVTPVREDAESISLRLDDSMSSGVLSYSVVVLDAPEVLRYMQIGGRDAVQGGA